MIHVLVVGNLDDSFASLPTLLAELAETTGQATAYASSIDLACAAHVEPDLIVVAQNWPDEYTVHDANRLIARFPLSRLVVGFGPWCLADGRTRKTWPGAVRVSHEHLHARLKHEWEMITAGFAPAVLLTSTPDDVFLAGIGFTTRFLAAPCPVALCTPDRELERFWSIALTERGYLSVPLEQAAVAIFDLDPWESRRPALQDLRRLFAGLIIGVTSDSATGHLKEALLSGADQSLPKLGFPQA